MQCKACKGSGEVCDGCGSDMTCWVECECGGNFCSLPSWTPPAVIAASRTPCWDKHQSETGHKAETA